MPLSPGVLVEVVVLVIVLLRFLPVFVALLRLTSMEASCARVVLVGLLLACLIVIGKATRCSISIGVVLVLLLSVFLSVPGSVILSLHSLIAEYIIGSSDLLEPVFVAWLAIDSIRMVLFSQFVELALNLVLGGRRLEAKPAVVADVSVVGQGGEASARGWPRCACETHVR